MGVGEAPLKSSLSLGNQLQYRRHNLNGAASCPTAKVHKSHRRAVCMAASGDTGNVGAAA